MSSDLGGSKERRFESCSVQFVHISFCVIGIFGRTPQVVVDGVRAVELALFLHKPGTRAVGDVSRWQGLCRGGGEFIFVCAVSTWKGGMALALALAFVY